MNYLIRHNKLNQPNGKAHIIVGADMACRLWSTGGVNKKRNWKISDTDKGQPVCTMCQNVKWQDGTGEKRVQSILACEAKEHQ